MFKYFKPGLLVLSLFFILSSCDKKEPTEVSSGVAQVETTVFSKTCENGSLNIKKEVATSAGVPAVIDIDDLPMGAEVTVSGTVANGAVCGFAGSVSFYCKAIVRIDLNKTFSCIADNRVSGTADGLLGTSAYHDSLYTSSYERALISGEFHTFYSGTKSFVSLKVSSSSPLVPAPCLLSFICN